MTATDSRQAQTELPQNARIFGAVLLCAAICAAAWVTRTRFPYTWDAVNFALAVDRIDLSQHQPHPPGHFGYVFAGRALRLITTDEHAALVLASVIASGIAAFLGFFLAFSSVSRCRWPTAAYTLLLILSSVTFAFYQRVAEIYMCDLLFTTAFAVAAVAAIDQRPRGALVVGVIWALAGWFKVSLLVMLLPAALYTALRISMPRRWIMAAAFSATLLAWLPATVNSSGPRPYFSSAYEQLSQGTSASRIGANRPMRALNRNGRDTFRFTLLTFGIGGLLAVLLHVAGRRRLLWDREKSRLFLLLVLPFFGVAMFIHIPKPGYVLPVLAVGSVYIAQVFAQYGRVGRLLLTASVAAATLHFWTGSAPPDAWMGGRGAYRSKTTIQKAITEVSSLMDFGYRSLQAGDDDITWLSSQVFDGCDTHDRALLVGDDDGLNWRKVMYAFPDATTVWLAREQPMLVAHQRRFSVAPAGETTEISVTCEPLFIAGAQEVTSGWPASPHQALRILATRRTHAVATADCPTVAVTSAGASARVVWRQ